MAILQQLGFALGFATLAGLNLYLTVFAASFAIYNGFLVIPPDSQYAHLMILGHPAVVITSGVLYFVEFFADKVPWVDSAWDAVHTFIRPIGGAFLAVQTLGKADPIFDVVAALLAGGVTLTAHGAKAGTRLIANGSPEPFSNIALSAAEDVGVFAGMGLMLYSYQHNPWLALIVFTSILGTLVYVTPKLFRFTRIKVWLLWKKLSSPAASAQNAVPASELTADAELLFVRLNMDGSRTVAWAVPCLTGSSKGGLPANFSGHLIATREEPRTLYFVGRRGWRSLAKPVELDGAKITHEARFLSDDLVVCQALKGKKQVFVFDRSRTALVRETARLIRERLTTVEGELVPSAEALPESKRAELVSA